MTDQQNPKTDELCASHIPALQVLMAIGYEYLPPEEALRRRGGNSEVLLRDVLVEELKKRRFTWKGKDYPLSTNAIDQIVRELASPRLGEGLLTANQRIYDMLTLGHTVTEFVDGQKASVTIPIIDWGGEDKPGSPSDNNQFHVTDEFAVKRDDPMGDDTRRPDIVCFVNGIPLAIIECKRPDPPSDSDDPIPEGISQNIRNQKIGEIPGLFVYSQLLFSVNSIDGRYGTTKTDAKFWSLWREEEISADEFAAIRNTPLSDEQGKTLFTHRKPWVRKYFEQQSGQGALEPSPQDKLLVSLLRPDRLLEFVRLFILFDQKVGKIAARHQQFFAIRKLIQRVRGKDTRGAREGGVIWHTTGSGKSFTMVFMARALIYDERLKACRFFVVTDRTDLEDQLSDVFVTAGVLETKRDIERAKAKTGADLARRISAGNERVLFSIINKFQSAVDAKNMATCRNESSDIIVLVDEGHRSHGGETHERMRQALPNAAYVAFTGTPLLKDDKTTSKFGPILHAYTMQQAVEDKNVTPLLYEERMPETGLNAKAIDNWFERITEGLTDQQRGDLKKKFAAKGQIAKSASRIELIAHDISDHFSKNIPEGMKGQLATDGKGSAIRYKKFLDEIGVVTSQVVMSAPDTRKGHKTVDDEREDPSDKLMVQEWWQKNVVDQGFDETSWRKEIVRQFGEEDDPQLLIVVSKLLTGFDEPKNAVLYIDKRFNQSHELLQAIARVNRLHDEKKFGLLIDYRGILAKLDTAIEDYQDLQERTQEGYDINDLHGLYTQTSTEYKRLLGLHNSLWAIFKNVNNRSDQEQFRQILLPRYETDANGDSVDMSQKVREDFYQALREFSQCLEVALGSATFFEDKSFSEEDRTTYKNDLRWFESLRKIARRDAGETVDYSAYEARIEKLIHKHVVGESVREPEGVIPVDQLGKNANPEEWSEEKTRNETDLIRSRVKRTIEQSLDDDPYAQKLFSELLEEAIREAEKLFDHPHDQYLLFKDFEEQVKQRNVPDSPAELEERPKARAFYGVFRLALGDEALADAASGDASYVDKALWVEQVVTTARAEYSLDPQSIENTIRKKLLPKLFKQIGMEKAREVIDQIIRIARFGPTEEVD